MSYTYDQFTQAANQAGLYAQFSPWDLQLAQANPAAGMQLLSAKQQWAAATDDAGRNAANQLAESIRSNASAYGLTNYTGGSWGSEYNPFGSQSSAPDWLGPSTITGGGSQPAPSNNYAPIQTPQFDTSPYQVQPYQSGMGSAPAYNSAYQQRLDEALAALSGYGNFQWDKVAPEYQNQYAELLAQLHGNVVNRDPFAYDYETDPVWQSYAKQYRREGDRATQNALGAAAMKTGGAPSTAAVTAAGQAGDYYSSRLMDQLPNLYQQAYNRYLGEFQMDLSKLDSTRGMERDDYSKYLTDLGQYNTDRDVAFNTWAQRYNQLYNTYGATMGADQNAFNQFLSSLDQWNRDRGFEYGAYRDQVGDAQWNQNFDYGMLRDNVGDQRYNQQFQYNAGRDQIGDSRYADEMAYSREQQAYLQQLELARLAAQYGDNSLLKNYGINPVTPPMSGGGGGSGGGAAAGGKPEVTDLLTRYIQGDESPELIAALMGAGLSWDNLRKIKSDMKEQGTEKLLERYYAGDRSKEVLAGLRAAGYDIPDGAAGGGVSTPVFNSQIKALDYMRQMGVKQSVAAGALPESEWQRKKAAGDPNAARFNSYEDYLTTYVRWAIEVYGT